MEISNPRRDRNLRLSAEHHELARILAYRLRTSYRSLLGQGLEVLAAKHPELMADYPVNLSESIKLMTENHGENSDPK